MKNCLNILETDNFKQLNGNPTKIRGNKIQRSTQKIKHKLIKQKYQKLYHTNYQNEIFQTQEHNISSYVKTYKAEGIVSVGKISCTSEFIGEKNQNFHPQIQN